MTIEQAQEIIRLLAVIARGMVVLSALLGCVVGLLLSLWWRRSS